MPCDEQDCVTCVLLYARTKGPLRLCLFLAFVLFPHVCTSAHIIQTYRVGNTRVRVCEYVPPPGCVWRGCDIIRRAFLGDDRGDDGRRRRKPQTHVCAHMCTISINIYDRGLCVGIRAHNVQGHLPHLLSRARITAELSVFHFAEHSEARRQSDICVLYSRLHATRVSHIVGRRCCDTRQIMHTRARVDRTPNDDDDERRCDSTISNVNIRLESRADTRPSSISSSRCDLDRSDSKLAGINDSVRSILFHMVDIRQPHVARFEANEANNVQIRCALLEQCIDEREHRAHQTVQ